MQPHTSRQPLALVCVAAPEDAALLARWETHLHPIQQGQHISIWSNRHLAAGTDRMDELRRQVDSADLVVLLLSADFFANVECSTLMEQALERTRTSTTRVIPLLLRPVAWQESPLRTLTPWPQNQLPLVLWSHQDEGWDVCIQELRRLLGRQVADIRSSQSSPKHPDPDWDRMLRRLRRSYKELLDQSLHGIARMELGFAQQPDLVSNVTTLLFRLPNGGERLFPAGTSIIDAFDEAEGELLILGAPGAGKSTLLLDLAHHLVDRAQSAEVSLLPVVLRLSSWALRQATLAEWMVEQLSRTYDVPQRLSERWIKEGRVLPLLDGLDELEKAARLACIVAINAYHHTHLAPLVVCSRHTEYEEAAQRERLALQSAVIVQPLSDEQIEGYLAAVGSPFAGVRAALHQEHDLWELATTPLMLSVLLLTYRGASAEEIIQQGTDLERQVWTDYVARQVAEKGHHTRYPLERTRAFLSWLAQQMRIHQQTTFYAEYLHDDWLAHNQQRTVNWLATRLPAMIIGVCVSLLVFVFLFGEGTFAGPLQLGLLGGFIGNSIAQQGHPGSLDVTSRFPHERWVHLCLAVLLGVLLAASFGFSRGRWYTLSDWARDGSILGLGSVFSFWIFQRLLSCTSGLHGSIGSRSPSWFKGLMAKLIRTVPPYIWLTATALGAGMALSDGLSAGLSYGLSLRLSLGPSEGLIEGLSLGLSDGLGVGLCLGVIVVLVHVILMGSLGPLRFVERIQWTWRGLLRPEHLRSSLFLAGTLFLFFGVIYGLHYGLSEGLFNGLNHGLIEGLSDGLSFGLNVGLSDGLGVGLSLGLSYWVVMGLYQGIQQEHLEDHNRDQFNQGIRRSLRNGLLLSLISALIVTTTAVLSLGLSHGLGLGLLWLNHGLSAGLIFGLSEGPIWLSEGLHEGHITLLASMIVLWALSGGLTVLHHYIIRWLLARHRTFPWRAQAFLDDATSRVLLRRVGGGYSFIHRRLQDYFADAAVQPPQK